MAGTVDGLTFRQDYFGDRAAWMGLVALLDDTFGIDVGLQDQFGGPDRTSMPFGYFDTDGRCVANFTAFSMPVMIEGRSVNAVGYQSGAVRPEWRGKGLYRDLMRKAFSWADAEGYDLHLLLTDKPALYAPYGFRSIAQHSFSGAPPEALPGHLEARNLSLPEDAAVIRGILDRRMPVSQRFAVLRQAEMFLLNACFNPDIRLTHLLDADAVVAWAFTDDRILLLDVAAADIADLPTILAALPITREEVEVCFPPDRLGWQGEAEPYDGHTILMVRGDMAAETIGPIMLSPMAEF